MKKVLFISSTGGHLAELMQLKELFIKFEYHIVTEHTHTNDYLKEKYPGRVDFLIYGTKSRLFTYLFKFMFNIIKSFVIFLKFKPDCVVTTGTHTAVPMCYIAKLFRRKVVYIETMANINTKTVTGKLVYRIADLFIVQWEQMQMLYPKAVYKGWIYE